MTSTAAPSADRIDLVCAADDAYAMPLAVTLRSSCDHLAPGASIRLFLLDGGIRDEHWMALKETLADAPIEVIPLRPDREAVADLTVSHHISHTAYYRLLTAELLPDSVNKVIYLDSDLLVLDDLTRLWRLSVGDKYCLAAVDIACPNIDARLGARNYRLSYPYMATPRPIRNYRALGIDGRDEYFNSGVMVINVDRWRREAVAECLLRCLRDYQRFVWCWDQYALNVLFAGQWGRLEPRWNQGAHAFEYPTAHHAPIDPRQWLEMKSNPAIVHFTTEFKPWQVPARNPQSPYFFRGLKQTAWHDWRPAAPQLTWKQSFDRRMVQWMKYATIAARKVAAIWG